MDKQEFYEKCEDILSSGHEYQEIWKNTRRSGRWGPRQPGNGRFKGYGLIRWFSADVVHISLYHPYSVNKTYPDEVALLFLENIMEFHHIDQELQDENAI